MPESTSEQEAVRIAFESANRDVVLMTRSALDDLDAELGGQERADTFLQECADRYDKPMVTKFRLPDGQLQTGGYFPAAWSEERIIEMVVGLKDVARDLEE